MNRREFLKALGLAPAVLALPAVGIANGLDEGTPYFVAENVPLADFQDDPLEGYIVQYRVNGGGPWKNFEGGLPNTWVNDHVQFRVGKDD